MNSKQTEEKDPFIEKHLAIIKQKIKDGLVEVHIARMGEFEKASIIKYFLEKVTVNCSFREKLNDLLDGMGASKNDQSLPSKPFGDVEEMAETYSEQKAVISFDSDDGHAHFNSEEIIKAFKSGYAAAPQKGEAGDAAEFLDWIANNCSIVDDSVDVDGGSQSVPVRYFVLKEEVTPRTYQELYRQFKNRKIK